MSFKENDVLTGKIVWLKSGGPAMTVKEPNGYGKWICSWFVNDEAKWHEFSASQLTDTNPNAADTKKNNSTKGYSS